MAAQEIDLLLDIQSWLLDTDYACAAVEQVYGGSVNLTFRGVLKHALEDGTRSIILKQSRGFMATVQTIACPLHRCLAEELILRSVSKQQVVSFHENVRVRTPRHYGTLLRHDSHLQIMEELPSTRTLKNLLHDPETWLSARQATAVGHALGKWLFGFHHSGCDRDDPVLAKTLGENSWLKDDMFPMMHTVVEQNVQDFPHLFKGVEAKIIRARTDAAFMMVEEDGMALRHGDLNISNIVVSADSSDVLLGIIDWEACHYGPRQHDLGVLLAGLISVERLCHKDIAARVLDGVLHSYPVRSEDSAFCTVAAVGAWLFLWPWWCSPPQSSPSRTRDVEGLVEFAWNLMTRGLERDKCWIKDTVLAPLFDRVEGSKK
ncbi:protein kinase-like protein [Aspergillus candidus]|uniref:Protein kinase-like protein n=1 Tax=Aspergillus candidus TaxID=41067 RepID=A0A2I2FDF0_ASPCN|nr:protein kinase-like protein [Aspergillus candidus]PLB38642.1 protein kinase-like protein [Aspergillus candidus]